MKQPSGIVVSGSCAFPASRQRYKRVQDTAAQYYVCGADNVLDSNGDDRNLSSRCITPGLAADGRDVERKMVNVPSFPRYGYYGGRYGHFEWGVKNGVVTHRFFRPLPGE